MKNGRINILQYGLPLAAVAMLSACGSSKPTDTNNQNSNQIVTVPKNETVTAMTGLPAAAENLEALTEQAFTASPEELVSLFTKAQESVAGISGQLSPQATKSLDGYLRDAKTAIDAGNPSDTALAAVEGYKLIVSAYPPDARIPAAVSLLDYAGFRIQADLKSDPKRWADAQEAAKYAHDQWDQIKDKVTDTDLNKRFTTSLSKLDEYLSVKDDKMAAKAAVTELDLVDELEGFFQPATKPVAPDTTN
ncbi:hypothetical protein [Parasphingorhabdus sp.]|jgi:hypothetical protein|uniref:hypothetical protein n=1 Tax=Parasphingorhabdus sp. TaxID=2709688 RepID=UPI0039E31FE3|tara:strand:- start:5216 stop:5962 length:747 start_codon:yes stop_codon:yes gene_type:complete